MEPEVSSRGGWALLIGIDTYPHFEGRLQLAGGVNDVRIMKDALVRRFGFQKDRIKVLTNLEATRTTILAALEDLIQRVGENESVIVHYSGHGSRKPDGPEEDEPDGYDETLVPCDSGRVPHPNRDITDDEIHDWLQRLMARTPYITLIFDCCNSGTAFRTLRVRGLPREERPAEWVPPKPAGPVFRDVRMGSKSWLKNGEGEKCVLFAACRSVEFAHEILVGDSPQVSYGALTYFLVQALMDPDFKGVTCMDVFERLWPGVQGQCGDQHPQLEGARDRELFGQATIPPMPFVSVLDRKGDLVTLEAGATCGLIRDTRWIVYAPGTRAIDDNAIRLGTVSIVSVGVTTSEAKVVEEIQPGAVIPGARAVEGFARLTVALEISPEHPRAEDLAIAVARSNLLARSYSGDPADARISLQMGAGGGEVWRVTDGVGSGLLVSEVLCSQPQALKVLADRMEQLARLYMLASLTNPGSALNGLVDFDILLWTPDGCVPPRRDEHGVMLFHDGDRLVLEVRNRSSCPLYIYVLDIGLTGRVGMAYPRQGSQELLETGQTHRVGTREGEDFTLRLPAGFDRLPEAARRDRETLKLIVSTSPGEYRLLFQSSQVYRSAWKEDWTTLEQTFRLLPKA